MILTVYCVVLCACVREEEEFRRQQAVRAEQERIKQDQLQQQQQMALSSSIAGADVPPADASSILTAAAAAPMETAEPEVSTYQPVWITALFIPPHLMPPVVPPRLRQISFLVAGQSVRLSDLTDEMFERMTPDEYEVPTAAWRHHALPIRHYTGACVCSRWCICVCIRAYQLCRCTVAGPQSTRWGSSNRTKLHGENSTVIRANSD